MPIDVIGNNTHQHFLFYFHEPSEKQKVFDKRRGMDVKGGTKPHFTCASAQARE